MKFLFTFMYECVDFDSNITSGVGSARITCAEDKITESVIDNAVQEVTENFRYDNKFVRKLHPLGWFRFEEE